MHAGVGAGPSCGRQRWPLTSLPLPQRGEGAGGLGGRSPLASSTNSRYNPDHDHRWTRGGREANREAWLGLYRQMLTPENFRFARQAGATHIVAHWVDYFRERPAHPAVTEFRPGLGRQREPGQALDGRGTARPARGGRGRGADAGGDREPRSVPLVRHPARRPARRPEQLEDVKTIVRSMGAAGIPVLGYNFSIAGVWGHVVGPWARGGAESVGFSAVDGPGADADPARAGLEHDVRCRMRRTGRSRR